MVNRILLLGNTGQLGWELHRSLAPLGDVFAWDQPQLDLTRPEAVREIIRSHRPDLVVNATAYTAVDKAESEPELARSINADAPGVMAEEAYRIGAALIHYSTDFVFNGQTDRPYTEADDPDPLSVYGATKLQGEEAVRAVGGAYVILRTSWVYSLRRRSFTTQVMEWARNRRVVRVASDQVGSPTWCRMLAETTAHLVARLGGAPRDSLGERAGVYHLAGSGAASRYEWAKLVLALDPRPEEHVVQEVQPASESEFPAPARRPRYSALDCERFRSTFGLQLPDWKEALRLAMAEG
jgi:dTDP-4-dehydrorhamnose reductase